MGQRIKSAKTPIKLIASYIEFRVASCQKRTLSTYTRISKKLTGSKKNEFSNHQPHVSFNIEFHFC